MTAVEVLHCDTLLGCNQAALCEFDDCKRNLCPDHGEADRSFCKHRETCRDCHIHFGCHWCDGGDL